MNTIKILQHFHLQNFRKELIKRIMKVDLNFFKIFYGNLLKINIGFRKYLLRTLG